MNHHVDIPKAVFEAHERSLRRSDPNEPARLHLLEQAARLSRERGDERARRRQFAKLVGAVSMAACVGAFFGSRAFFRSTLPVASPPPSMATASSVAQSAGSVSQGVVPEPSNPASDEPTASRLMASRPPRPAGPAPASRGGEATASAAARSSVLDGLLIGRRPGTSALAPEQCLTSGQVGAVIGLHQVAVRRICWDKNPSTRPAANAAVSLTVGGDGSPQGVSATGDEPSVTKCVESNVRQWHFPAMGCTQTVNIPFHFVR